MARFNTQPRGGGCAGERRSAIILYLRFNTQPRGGGCKSRLGESSRIRRFQHTAARRRLHITTNKSVGAGNVSTHSRAEAAAFNLIFGARIEHRFNTQPRGGGCSSVPATNCSASLFQHTAARRRLLYNNLPHKGRDCCFNTQPRGGGCAILSCI